MADPTARQQEAQALWESGASVLSSLWPQSPGAITKPPSAQANDLPLCSSVRASEVPGSPAILPHAPSPRSGTLPHAHALILWEQLSDHLPQELDPEKPVPTRVCAGGVEAWDTCALYTRVSGVLPAARRPLPLPSSSSFPSRSAQGRAITRMDGSMKN